MKSVTFHAAYVRFQALQAETVRLDKLVETYHAGIEDWALGSDTPEYQMAIWRRWEEVCRQYYAARLASDKAGWELADIALQEMLRGEREP